MSAFVLQGVARAAVLLQGVDGDALGLPRAAMRLAQVALRAALQLLGRADCGAVGAGCGSTHQLRVEGGRRRVQIE